MYLTITRAELDEFPKVYWEADFGFGFGEWAGNDFAEINKQYDCYIGVNDHFFWGKNMFPSSLCEARIYSENDTMIINGLLDTFVRMSDEDTYSPDNPEGTLVHVCGWYEDFRITSYKVPEDMLGKYVMLKASSLRLIP